MAKIIYKDGCEGQNSIDCILGIEIDLNNDHFALIYPQYTLLRLLSEDKIDIYDARILTKDDALYPFFVDENNKRLLDLESPAVKFVKQIQKSYHLPSLYVAAAIQAQKTDIDKLAQTIKGADLLCNYNRPIWSAERSGNTIGWVAYGERVFGHNLFSRNNLCVPVVEDGTTLIKLLGYNSRWQVHKGNISCDFDWDSPL